MKSITIKLLRVVITYALFTALVFMTCRYRLTLIEGLGTFYYGHDFTAQMLRTPTGLVDWLSLLLVQLFSTPAATAFVAGAVLTLAAWLTDLIIRHITGSDTLSPLSLLAPTALCMVQPDIYCHYAYTVSFVLMLIAIVIVTEIHHEKQRLAVGLLMPLLLMHCSGAIATVYALSITIIEVTAAPRRINSWLYALTIPFVAILAYLAVLTGIQGDFVTAVTPADYYTPWFTAPASLYLSWVTFVAVILFVCLFGGICLKYRRIALAASSAAAIAFGCYAYIGYHSQSDELYAELTLYADSNEWDRLSDRYHDAGIDDQRLRNLYNLSLAERGQLSKVLFQQSCTGTETVLDTSSKRPDHYMLLGDIYYSMGHIALAQKHTFEANEGFGNLSPRLLKRLADINIITGEYGVAEKYLNLLSKTLLYKDWAAERRSLLYDDAAVAANSELGPKRRCIFPDSRFTAAQGIESDLVEILRQNPGHKPTMEYLGALTLLSRNVPVFTAITKEFYGTPAMSTPLPKHYQEALAIATLVSGDRLDIMYQLHPSTVQRCQDFWARHQDQPGTFWHYLRASKPQQ